MEKTQTHSDTTRRHFQMQMSGNPRVNGYLLLQICSNNLGCASNFWNSGNRTQNLEFGLQKS